MEAIKEDKQWWVGFQQGHNFTLEGDLLTVYIYDPPEYSSKIVEIELNPHTAFGHELSHGLSGAFYFKGFDPSSAFLWSEEIHDRYDPGRALFYECWVIYGQTFTDPNITDLSFKLEHHAKGKTFLEETYPILYKVPIPEKWIQRWDKLKEQFDVLADFRKNLPIDSWFPSGFKRYRLAKLENTFV